MNRPTPCMLAGWALVSIALFISPLRIEAHDHRPPWLDSAALDGGLYVATHYPRVIRAPGPITITVELLNVAGERNVTIEHIRYVDADDRPVETHRLNRTLPTQRATFEEYRNAADELEASARLEDTEGVQRLTRRSRTLLQQLSAARLTDRYRVSAEQVPSQSGTYFRATVEIQLNEEGLGGHVVRVIRRLIEIPIAPSLPRTAVGAIVWRYDVATGDLHSLEDRGSQRGAGDDAVWFAGDQHLHTTYSLDALVLDGTVEDVTDYAGAAESIGLDWIIINDHSNVHVNWGGTEYYTSEQFAAGTVQAADYTAGHDMLALYGQEMGAGQAGLFSLPSHYLAYPFDADSTGYLENPSSGLIFGLANCEPEQVIIDRVNDAGGFGFIAHPFDAGTLAFAEWDFQNGATGWSGLEIWSDTLGQIKPTDLEALSKWYALLNAIPGPSLGELADRPDFPNPFPVGLGNSDAHTPALIGATFTYSWMPAVSRADVVGSLMQGRCVASNGPLLFGEINGARIGEVAFLLDGDNELDLTLTTTSEFGPVGDYELTVYVNGVIEATVPPTGDSGFSMTVRLEGLNLNGPDTFVTMQADSVGGVYHAITNPLWLQFTSPGDADADGAITLGDFAALADCMTEPGSERTPSCDIMDFDRDRDVDLIDFAAFQRVFTGP